MILAERTLATSALNIRITEPIDLVDTDFLGLNIITSSAKLEIVTVYSPSGMEPEMESLEELLRPTEQRSARVVYGDFNAHSYTWGSQKSDVRGNRLLTASEYCNVVVVNDNLPTHVPAPQAVGNNLDLIFVESVVFPSCSFSLAGESTSHRLNIKEVDWTTFD